METGSVYYVSLFLLIYRAEKNWQVDLFLFAMCEMKVEYVR